MFNCRCIASINFNHALSTAGDNNCTVVYNFCALSLCHSYALGKGERNSLGNCKNLAVCNFKIFRERVVGGKKRVRAVIYIPLEISTLSQVEG